MADRIIIQIEGSQQLLSDLNAITSRINSLSKLDDAKNKLQTLRKEVNDLLKGGSDVANWIENLQAKAENINQLAQNVDKLSQKFVDSKDKVLGFQRIMETTFRRMQENLDGLHHGVDTLNEGLDAGDARGQLALTAAGNFQDQFRRHSDKLAQDFQIAQNRLVQAAIRVGDTTRVQDLNDLREEMNKSIQRLETLKPEEAGYVEQAMAEVQKMGDLRSKQLETHGAELADIQHLEEVERRLSRLKKEQESSALAMQNQIGSAFNQLRGGDLKGAVVGFSQAYQKMKETQKDYKALQALAKAGGPGSEAASVLGAVSPLKMGMIGVAGLLFSAFMSLQEKVANENKQLAGFGAINLGLGNSADPFSSWRAEMMSFSDWDSTLAKGDFFLKYEDAVQMNQALANAGMNLQQLQKTVGSIHAINSEAIMLSVETGLSMNRVAQLQNQMFTMFGMGLDNTTNTIHHMGEQAANSKMASEDFISSVMSSANANAFYRNAINETSYAIEALASTALFSGKKGADALTNLNSFLRKGDMYSKTAEFTAMGPDIRRAVVSDRLSILRDQISKLSGQKNRTGEQDAELATLQNRFNALSAVARSNYNPLEMAANASFLDDIDMQRSYAAAIKQRYGTLDPSKLNVFQKTDMGATLFGGASADEVTEKITALFKLDQQYKGNWAQAARNSSKPAQAVSEADRQRALAANRAMASYKEMLQAGISNILNNIWEVLKDVGSYIAKFVSILKGEGPQDQDSALRTAARTGNTSGVKFGAMAQNQSLYQQSQDYLARVTGKQEGKLPDKVSAKGLGGVDLTMGGSSLASAQSIAKRYGLGTQDLVRNYLQGRKDSAFDPRAMQQVAMKMLGAIESAINQNASSKSALDIERYVAHIMSGKGGQYQMSDVEVAALKETEAAGHALRPGDVRADSSPTALLGADYNASDPAFRRSTFTTQSVKKGIGTYDPTKFTADQNALFKAANIKSGDTYTIFHDMKIFTNPETLQTTMTDMGHHYEKYTPPAGTH